MKKEEFEKVNDEVCGFLKRLNEMKVYCVQEDRKFDASSVDQAIAVIGNMAKKYLNLLKREIPQKKLVCCPNCRMEVELDETKCPWCGQVFT